MAKRGSMLTDGDKQTIHIHENQTHEDLASHSIPTSYKHKTSEENVKAIKTQRNPGVAFEKSSGSSFNESSSESSSFDNQ